MVSVTAPPSADEELQHVSDTYRVEPAASIHLNFTAKSETQLLCILIQNSLGSA